ncbi:MAG: hypothetical protein QOJ29_2426 [Thermoleophilaceae bacterium]|jgi:hypothetical protein|nr:hypothetical protein [Thermoleophilaceae bacterium]
MRGTPHVLRHELSAKGNARTVVTFAISAEAPAPVMLLVAGIGALLVQSANTIAGLMANHPLVPRAMTGWVYPAARVMVAAFGVLFVLAGVLGLFLDLTA